MPTTLASCLTSISAVPKAKSSERRDHTRYPFTATLEAVEPDSETTIQGRTADLSKGGCYVDTLSPFPAHTRVKVRITRDKRSFETEATVVYSVAGMGMGLRFGAIASHQLTILTKWLSELSGESPAEPHIQEKRDSFDCSSDGNRVLNELVGELMRKGVLPEDMARGMLARLSSAC